MSETSVCSAGLSSTTAAHLFWATVNSDEAMLDKCSDADVQGTMFRHSSPDVIRKQIEEFEWLAGLDDRNLYPDGFARESSCSRLSIAGRELFWDVHWYSIV